MDSFFFAYHDPLFIGGWKDILQLVSNVNGRSLKVPPILSVIPRWNFREILGMVEIHFIPEVVEARPKSSMHCFCIRVGFSIVSRAGHALCMLYTVLARVVVHAVFVECAWIFRTILHSFFIIFPN
jgi:hypothetical protein